MTKKAVKPPKKDARQSPKQNGTSLNQPPKRKPSSSLKNRNNSLPWYSVAAAVTLVGVLVFLVIQFDLMSNFSGSKNQEPSQTPTNRKSSKSSSTSKSKKPSQDGGAKSPSNKVKDIGGWRLASQEIAQKFDSDICSIDRVYALDLTIEEFESKYRYKKPVIISFPKGANSWTDSKQWTLDNLKKAYSDWSIFHGNSMEIVRRGGNGHEQSTFKNFVDGIMRNDNLQTEPSYVFDRNFFNDSNLPSTLHPPKYFEIKNSLDDSIFFLGASGSGVSFHKHADAWNGVVYGRKRWFLYPTTLTPPGGVYPGFTQQDWIKNVYPKLEKAVKPMECVQEAGEILYLPEGTYHGTVNLGDTVAIGIQKKSAVTPSEKLFYEEQQVLNKINSGEFQDDKLKSLKDRRINIYKELHKLLPDNAEVYMKLGEVYSQYGQEKRGASVLQKAIETDPYFVLAYLNKARVQEQRGVVKEADNLFRRALELNDKLWDVHAHYGNFLMHQKRPAEAVPHFKKGTELAPEQTAFWLYLQQAQQQSGDMTAAKETAMKLEELRVTKMKTRTGNVGKL